MPIQMLEHYTVRCSDLDRTRDFYCDVLGLKVGPRPPLPIKGYWIYVGDTPTIHLVDRAESESMDPGERSYQHTGSVDHVAFAGDDIDGMRAALRRAGQDFKEISLPGDRDLIFVLDPDNVTVELNFRGGKHH